MINKIKFNIPNTEHGIEISLEEPVQIVGEQAIVTLPNQLFDVFGEDYKKYREELK